MSVQVSRFAPVRRLILPVQSGAFSSPGAVWVTHAMRLPAVDRGSMANPEVLEAFVAYAASRLASPEGGNPDALK